MFKKNNNQEHNLDEFQVANVMRDVKGRLYADEFKGSERLIVGRMVDIVCNRSYIKVREMRLLPFFMSKNLGIKKTLYIFALISNGTEKPNNLILWK